MLVVTRLRTPSAPGGDPDAAAEAELRAGLLQALAILAAKPGYVGGEVGRNVDDPTLWALTTRWENVGSYRRALGSYEGKMHIQPLMVHALDEPSAYEVVEEGTDLNVADPRSLG
ncbi:MAG TPA: antibiotic biosynthesis monooxygenase [Nocardioides sp.]